jgi:hypothetical protein
MLERIDHMVCPVTALEAVAAAYERLGLVLTPRADHEAAGIANRACFVGTGASNFSYLELLAVTDAGKAKAAGRQAYLDAASNGGGMVGLVFGVANATEMSANLKAKGLDARVEAINRDVLIVNRAHVHRSAARMDRQSFEPACPHSSSK